MSYVAGQRVKAVNLPSPYYLQQAATADTTFTTTTEADLTGATITFTVNNATATCLVFGTFDCVVNTTGASIGIMFCTVDGADQTQQGLFSLTTSGERATVAQNWGVALGSAGSHTIKFRGRLSAAAGSLTIHGTHTILTILVMDY